MYAAFEKVNPFRSPAWRFERVLQLVSNRPRPLPASRAHDDIYVRTYRRFLMQIQSREAAEDQMELFLADQGLYLAHMLHHNPDKEWRAIAQASILARESDEKVADRIHSIPSAIDWYEKLFFNVRDRLKSRIYIIKTVLGRPDERRGVAVSNAMSDYQRDMCLKLFGYFGGPLVLEWLLAGIADHGFPRKVSEFAGWVDKTWSSEIRIQSMAMGRTFAVDKFTVMQLFDLHARMMESDRAAQSAAGGAPMDYRRNVEALLNEIPWVVGEKGFNTKNAVEHEYDLTAVEPRADEAMQLAMGVEPAELAEVRELQMRIAEEKK